jgi:VWFA-related protein
MRPTLAPVVMAAAVIAGASAQQPPRFVSPSSELVVLPVVVVDHRGDVVADLPRDAFSVYDNGRRQPIALFSNQDRPVTVGLIVDDSGSMGPKGGEVLAAAATLARDSNPDDQIFAVAFNDSARRLLPGRPIVAGDPSALREALAQLAPDGRTALYDAVLLGLDSLEQGTNARKALVVISDGADNASRAGLEEVLARARRSDVPIYTVGLFDAQDYDTNPGVLKKLARETGGERYLPDSPGRLLQDCRHIARAIRSSYVIGYEPPRRDGRYHRVRVEVRGAAGRRLDARTRLGYVASGGSS